MDRGSFPALEIKMQKADPDSDLNWADYIDDLQSLEPVLWSRRPHRLAVALPATRHQDAEFGSADGNTDRNDRRRCETPCR